VIKLYLLNDFVHLRIKETLDAYYQQSDYKNYCVQIHGFKNNAYSVGATRLGDLAFEMEKRTRIELPESIEILQRNLFEQYDKICEAYNEIIKM